MSKFTSEVYKCVVLTVIAILLGVIVWRLPRQQFRVYVENDSITVDGSVKIKDFENPLPVEVQNEVEVTGSVQIDR